MVVVSPLIALMQDQAAQLAQMGIPAAVLNSSLSADRAVRGEPEGARRANIGCYMFRPSDWRGRIRWRGWKASDFVLCDRRSALHFRMGARIPSRIPPAEPPAAKFSRIAPIAAFTASATRQVRHDIIAQLRLRDPDKYIASFHRPNLRYIVKAVRRAHAVGLAADAH